MQNFGRLPGRLPNRPERVAATRASLLARVRIGDAVGTLRLPCEHFSSSMERLFTEQELHAMANDGLPIPFYDERGRVFSVHVDRMGGDYQFSGANGWGRMARMNDLRENTIISLWVFREKMELGSIMELPRLMFVVEDDQGQLYCKTCKRVCMY